MPLITKQLPCLPSAPLIAVYIPTRLLSSSQPTTNPPQTHQCINSHWCKISIWSTSGELAAITFRPFIFSAGQSSSTESVAKHKQDCDLRTAGYQLATHTHTYIDWALIKYCRSIKKSRSPQPQHNTHLQLRCPIAMVDHGWNSLTNIQFYASMPCPFYSSTAPLSAEGRGCITNIQATNDE